MLPYTFHSQAIFCDSSAPGSRAPVPGSINGFREVVDPAFRAAMSLGHSRLSSRVHLKLFAVTPHFPRTRGECFVAPPLNVIIIVKKLLLRNVALIEGK